MQHSESRILRAPGRIQRTLARLVVLAGIAVAMAAPSTMPASAAAGDRV